MGAMTAQPPDESVSRAVLTETVLVQLRALGSEMSDLSRRFGARYAIDHSAARALLVMADARREGRDVTAGSIGREVGLSSASVTALIDRLVSSGHLRREPDPHDRRRVLLRMEPSAERLGPEYFGPLAADLARRLEAFDDHDLGVISDFLAAAIGSVADHRTSSPQLDVPGDAI